MLNLVQLMLLIGLNGSSLKPKLQGPWLLGAQKANTLGNYSLFQPCSHLCTLLSVLSYKDRQGSQHLQLHSFKCHLQSPDPTSRNLETLRSFLRLIEVQHKPFSTLPQMRPEVYTLLLFFSPRQ